MNKMMKLLGGLLVFGIAGSASATQFKFSGDLNNRFMLYTDQAGFYSTSESIGTITAPGARLVDGTVGETWGELKYRFQFEGATDDGAVKGVYAIELGAIRFGDRTAGTAGQRGGGYSGDGNNYETRFAYVDFALAPKSRVQVGLMPFTVNKFLWSETATGVQVKGSAGPAGYTLAWIRGNEIFNTNKEHQQFRDADNLLLRGDFTAMPDVKVGLFGLYQRTNPEASPSATVVPVRSHLLKNFANIAYDLYNVGLDGSAKFGPGFVNFDFIYQGGESSLRGISSAPGSLDHSAFLAHGDVGASFGPAKVTYTAWYATGDDDATDGDAKNFIATDVDMFDSIVLFEGGYTDDVYFTEAPYFLDKGAFINRLGVDFKASDKLTLSGAALYVMTAKDLNIGTGATAGTSKKLGTELDGAISYKLNPNLELAVNAGYLFAGDGMDAFEQVKDGEANRNIFRTTARARYQF